MLSSMILTTHQLEVVSTPVQRVVVFMVDVLFGEEAST